MFWVFYVLLMMSIYGLFKEARRSSEDVLFFAIVAIGSMAGLLWAGW